MSRLALGCLMAASLYGLAALQRMATEGDALPLAPLPTLQQFMPMLYVAAFIALPRGAAVLSWLHYAGLLLLYALHFARPAWNGLMPPSGHVLAQAWFTMLLAHPCYILALQYLNLVKRRLLQSERKAHADKRHFLAMLSHEIRSPLQAMLASIDLLALKVQQGPEQRAVDRLRHAAGQLDAHLRDVTEFTRLEDPAWQLHVETVDLCRLLRDTCDTWQAQSTAKGLTLRCDIATDAQATLQHCRTDPQRVQQILNNLLSNAVKYTPSGHICVHARLASDRQHWLLEVTDTGVGMPEPARQRIVEPYVRLEDPRAGHTEGAGLGLAVVHRLVGRLRGELHIDSQPERGSCFSVRLPLSN